MLSSRFHVRAHKGSPSSAPGQLIAPHYAGNIQHVREVGEVDDENWEQEVADFLESDWIDLGGDDGDAGEQCDEGKPPDVSPEEFAALDQAAGYEEISRLPEMKACHEPSAQDFEEGTILSTRSVMDWRFRNQKWQRRCRYVAREFRGGDKGMASTFAPTSGAGARLVLVGHCCYQGCVPLGAST